MATPAYPHEPPYPLEIPEEFWIIWWSQKSISPIRADQPYVSGRFYPRDDAVRAAQEMSRLGDIVILLRRTSDGIVEAVPV